MTDTERLRNDRFHDLRTQLTLITGYVQLAQRAAGRTPPDEGQLVAYLVQARQTMTVLMALIDAFQCTLTCADGRDDPFPSSTDAPDADAHPSP